MLKITLTQHLNGQVSLAAHFPGDETHPTMRATYPDLLEAQDQVDWMTCQNEYVGRLPAECVCSYSVILVESKD